MQPVRFITINPGHFHAALVQKEMYPQVAPTVHVYGPMGPDLVAHLQRIAGFNTRAKNPTEWQVEVHASPDYLERFHKDKPGNVVILAGRNRNKIDAILSAIDAGMHVLADKPWILTPDNIPKLETALDQAEKKGLVAYDIMTERYEITSLLQRELVQTSSIFGTIIPGSTGQPGVYMESVHFLKKLVAGAPLRRPAWFFDVNEQGEGLSDVGTHLVDLVMWMLSPNRAICPNSDVTLIASRRTPTEISRQNFQSITGEPDFPLALQDQIQRDTLPYYCNTYVNYTVQGVHVKLDVLWGLEAEPGAGDTHVAVFRGSQARIEVRQGRDEGFVPELYIYPNSAIDLYRIRTALEVKLASLQETFPGVGMIDLSTHFRLSIPSEYRVGHEPHFAQVTEQFLRYVQNETTLPAWEKSNMLAKYRVTTGGVELSRKSL